jgi:hypothetical protein
VKSKILSRNSPGGPEKTTKLQCLGQVSRRVPLEELRRFVLCQEEV